MMPDREEMIKFIDRMLDTIGTVECELQSYSDGQIAKEYFHWLLGSSEDDGR